jgi:hypothetical protein
MKFSILFLTALFFSGYGHAESYRSCPKGTVWNGVQCVNICPEGYVWNESGKCVRQAPEMIESAACKVADDAYFKTVPTGCRYEKSGLIFGRRSKGEMFYRSAEIYCKRIEAGKKDWRLPTAEELEEIAGDTIAGAYLNFRTDANFWTSNIIEDVKYRYDSHGDWFDTTVLVSNKMVNLYSGFTSWRSSKIVENNKESWNQSNAAHTVCVRQDVTTP